MALVMAVGNALTEIGVGGWCGPGAESVAVTALARAAHSVLSALGINASLLHETKPILNPTIAVQNTFFIVNMD